MLLQKDVNTKAYAYDIVKIDRMLMNIMLKMLKEDVSTKGASVKC